MKNSLNKFKNSFLKKATVGLVLGVMCVSTSFAFTLRNDNSSGGEDDYVWAQLSVLNYGDIREDDKCTSNPVGPDLYGRPVLSTDIPYGVSFTATHHSESGVINRLCIVIQYKSQYLKVAFNDDPACSFKFWFVKEAGMYRGYIDDISRSSLNPNGFCALKYEN